MTKLRSLLLFLVCFCSCWCCQILCELSLSHEQEFIKSFIHHYEFGPEGRYTHEYHPFLLTRTAQSFADLELRLKQENFSLLGRMIIMGYEENAVPAYYTNYKHSGINDEAMRKNNTGWSLRLHNRFGFMTGFLFKDLASTNPIFEHFEHIDGDDVAIFDDRATLFQEHAFGQALPLMRREQERMMHMLAKKTPADIVAELSKFWKLLYSNAFKVGNKQIAGTQDVLFSIEYARHLSQSQLPVCKFFTGPDITYPIEVTAKQDRCATIHAQHFAQRLLRELVSQDGQNTAYIFCSFVDGVGKSTMLGNIKNWMHWSGNIEEFAHVDNSSSQVCDLFKLKPGVYIADLPAQVSHFTYKPDGIVFVDVRTLYDAQQCAVLTTFINTHKEELRDECARIFAAVKNIIAERGYCAPEFSDTKHPDLAFVRNVILLGKEQSNVWIPFIYQGKSYLFKDSEPLEIRCVTSLAAVKSEGLKNIEAEQMLFSEGLRFPLPYEHFLKDLVTQLKSQNIKNIVFVDFLSMYPRSSRENVRINYLLQQMALLDTNFHPEQSLYRDFVSGGELLAALCNKKSCTLLKHAFQHEAMIRGALFDLINNRVEGDLTGYDMATVTALIRDKIAHLDSEFHENIVHNVAHKFYEETKRLETTYGLSKQFINVQQLSLRKLAAFHTLIQEFFTQHGTNDLMRTLWQSWGNVTSLGYEVTESRPLAMTLTTDAHIPVQARYIIHEACKDEALLKPLLRSLRAQWYAALSGLFFATDVGCGLFSMHQLIPAYIPLMMIPYKKNFFLVAQRSYEPWKDKVPMTFRIFFQNFNFTNFRAAAYRSVGDHPCRYDWDCGAVNNGLFGFDYVDVKDESEEAKYLPQSTITRLVQRYQQENNAQIVMPTEILWQRLNDVAGWQYEYEQTRSSALRKGQRSEKLPPLGGYNMNVYIGSEQQEPAARLAIRLLATLDMILKDPESSVVIRNGNREDFKAALKLFEYVIVPRYFKTIFANRLFSDYDAVEPYPSWEFWDRLDSDD